MSDEIAKHLWLEPLVFADGKFLPNRIIPGPMEGISEGSYVSVMSGSGMVKSWFTPFIRISNGVPRNARLKYKVEPYLATGLPVIAQIMGIHTELMAEAARRLHQTGVTCVDLNCACPSSKVIGNKSGGFALTRPQWICDTLTAMKKACGKAAVSVKIRCGYESTDEMPDIAAAIMEAHPDMVTCHFRTVKEGYQPVSNGLDRLAVMRELMPGMTLIGSGDLFSVEDARKMYDTAAVDGVAPARGLLKNPALLTEIEAYCKGVDGAEALSADAKLAFLNQVGEVSGHRRKDQGFILKIAKVMFGQETEEFRNLMEDVSRGIN